VPVFGRLSNTTSYLLQSQVSDSEVEYLIQRINQAPFVGTIDSILRDVLSEIASDIGFEEMPVVGNTARQKHLHKARYRAVQEDPTWRSE